MKHIRRLAAILGIALLAILYIATLFCAIFDVSNGMVLFKASVTCTVLVPILLWGYTVIYRLARGKNEQELQEALRGMESEKESQEASRGMEPGKNL